jgi:hypothetical protein
MKSFLASFAFFLFTCEKHNHLSLSPLRVLVFVLGLPLDSSNPAKEEEREFLTQTSSIIITLPVAWHSH